MYVCVHTHADPVVMGFVPGVGCGFLCVCNVMWESFRGMHLNIVKTFRVAGIMLSLLINYSICT